MTSKKNVKREVDILRCVVRFVQHTRLQEGEILYMKQENGKIP